MDGKDRTNIKPGALVNIVRKLDQASGRLTQGMIKDILTNSPTHPHGIKVRLTNGEVGRVKEILPDQQHLIQTKEASMGLKKAKVASEQMDHVVAQARRKIEQFEKSYREKALKIFPWICVRCSREFTSKNIHQLTVHHRDNDHTNNPSDGGNWELLCIYCHDNEHSRDLDESRSGGLSLNSEPISPATFKPFAGLKDLLKDKKIK